MKKASSPPSKDDRVSPATTYLRVKRPRYAESLQSFQFQGKKRIRPDSVSEITELMSKATHQQQEGIGNRVVWKRIQTLNSPHIPHKRSLKLVDAVLDENKASKRQRLALTLVETTLEQHQHQQQQQKHQQPSLRSRRNVHVVLDPTSRLVDESLKQVRDGSKTVHQHLAFLAQDERLGFTPTKWIGWKLVTDGGNILHAAALWNDVEGTRHVLTMLNSQESRKDLMEATNSDHSRPYQIAKMAQHEQVAELLEAFGADTVDYVYDVFCLHKGPEEKQHKSGVLDAPIVELRGGVGYWTRDGELVLEALAEDHDDDSTETVQADDDVDSNAENYEFNDYPDEPSDSDDSWDDEKEARLMIHDYEDGYDAQYGLF